MNITEPRRPLTQEELELLHRMFEHGSDDLRSFRPQMEGIRVTRS